MVSKKQKWYPKSKPWYPKSKNVSESEERTDAKIMVSKKQTHGIQNGIRKAKYAIKLVQMAQATPTDVGIQKAAEQITARNWTTLWLP